MRSQFLQMKKKTKMKRLYFGTTSIFFFVYQYNRPVLSALGTEKTEATVLHDPHRWHNWPTEVWYSK